MASKKGSYTPMPAVPDDLEERYRVTLAVLSGMITLSEGARRLGLSRVQYQTIMHRGLHGRSEALPLAIRAALNPEPIGLMRARRFSFPAAGIRLRRQQQRIPHRGRLTSSPVPHLPREALRSPAFPARPKENLILRWPI